ncbi:MAG: hypothetical protein JRM73_01630 [Nitrososphaerota archaeon]|nr:hypothetical protein [Nitrososphaerota archaeon]
MSEVPDLEQDGPARRSDSPLDYLDPAPADFVLSVPFEGFEVGPFAEQAGYQSPEVVRSLTVISAIVSRTSMALVVTGVRRQATATIRERGDAMVGRSS